MAGATVVFTGTLKSMNRDQAEALVRELGGRPAKSISRRTRFVVAGSRAGSTLDKAKSAGVEVIDEAQFQALVDAAKSGA